VRRLPSSGKGEPADPITVAAELTRRLPVHCHFTWRDWGTQRFTRLCTGTELGPTGAILCQLDLRPTGWVRIVSVMADTPPPDHAGFVHALKVAADNVEQHLARSSGLEVGQVAILVYLDLHQPATIPDVAAGVGRGYRWAQAILADLRSAGLVVKWPSNPARFALSDAATELVAQMNAAVWNAISSAHGWPAAVIAGTVLGLLGAPFDGTPAFEGPASTSLSDVAVAAGFLGIEPQIIDAWVRSGSLPSPPWNEDDLRSMNGLRGSVAAVWPELLEGARSGYKFASLTKRLGLTTQKVAAAIWRDPALRAELDQALMQGRDPKIQHGRRLAYREGCWCPECRTAQLGPTR